MKNLDLYLLAEAEGIEVHPYPMVENGSSTLMTSKGNCYIAMDHCALADSDTERMHLAHELGHCMTGSFYNYHSKLDIREKHERRANVWAFKRVVPLETIRKCMKQGLTEPWQMEDMLDVPARFIRQAMEYYASNCTSERGVFGG